MRHLTGTWLRHSGDFWGGFAAMLVVLPASVAFGVTVYAAISPDYAPFGALAGALGAMSLGLIAPIFGGTARLISAPCAPAAVMLSAFAVGMVHKGVEPASIVLMITVLGILTGMLQILIGFLGVGRLIKYIPYPVVSGYLSGIGLIIIASQLPKFVGAPMDVNWFQVLTTPQYWDWRGLLIGVVTVLAMCFSGKIIKKIPSTIVGIVSGLLTYGCIALYDSSMLQLAGNNLVIGTLGASGEGYVNMITERWDQIGQLRLTQIAELVGSALILATLLSIDTLKTCVVLDQKTRTYHDSNRELTGQGLGNAIASMIGGMPGAGVMGGSMVNLSSGAQTRISGIIAGLLTIFAVLLLGSFVAWIPVATLSAILIVIGFRMIDTDPLRFLESSSTILDFLVVLAVICVAIKIDLVAAAVVGVILSILLFLREQVGGNVLLRKSFVGQRSSTWFRPEKEMRILEAKGENAVIFELQGSLFFGTAHLLYRTLEPELSTKDFIIIDMKRVQSIDITAAYSLNVAHDILAKRNVPLLFSNVPESLPNGRNLREFLEFAGLAADGQGLFYKPTLEESIEWVENHLLGESSEKYSDEGHPLELHEIEIFKGSATDTLTDLEVALEKRHWKAGETIYALGEPNINLYLIRKGKVKIMSRVGKGSSVKHVATFGRGEFFGALGFFDHRPRMNDAIATRDADIYVLTQEEFKKMSQGHRRVALVLTATLARLLAVRLRHIEKELALLESGSQ